MTFQETKIKTVKKNTQLPNEKALKSELRHPVTNATGKPAISHRTERPNYRLRLL